MPADRVRSSPRLALLIIAPVLLLAGIAIFGLVEYRHAIMAGARTEAEKWASPRQAAFAMNALRAEADARLEVRLYRDIPVNPEGSAGPDGKRLAAATEARNLELLRELLDSTGTTRSGLPVRVLAAWRVFELTGAREDAEVLATLAIRESPSAISAPILAALQERFPEESEWEGEWKMSEERRAILAGAADATGLIMTPEGAAVIVGNKVLRPEETRDVLVDLRDGTNPPPWLQLDYLVLERSIVSPIADPLVTAGGELKIAAGIGDRQALFVRYWRVVWWVAAIILCALGTAVAGIWLTQRTVARERRLNHLKGQFVASVSHELRTPVASMRLMADALEAGKVTGEKAQEFHRLISQEGARLSALIENVLEFARIEEGRKLYVFTETDLPALVRDTIKLVEPVAKEQGVGLETRIETAAGSPSLDPAAIQQALVNLLDNAIKFSPESGTVRVGLESGLSGWELSVSDEGDGIAEADREQVFERFIRLENELERETQGAGIGLSIVKHTVEAHGGRVSIGDAPGGGAVFVIRCATQPGEGEGAPGPAGVSGTEELRATSKLETERATP